MKVAAAGLVTVLALFVAGCGSRVSTDSGHGSGNPAAPTTTTASSATAATAVASADRQACRIYSTMKFDDKHDEATAYAVWKIRSGLTGGIATFADTHHKAWADTDYAASMRMLRLWPSVQKQCASFGVKVKNWQVVSYGN